jgi:hypothetical protein
MPIFSEYCSTRNLTPQRLYRTADRHHRWGGVEYSWDQWRRTRSDLTNYESAQRIAHFLFHRDSSRSEPNSTLLNRVNAERLRSEFEDLAQQWRNDTRHLSQVSKKVTHRAYFRIMGMGEAAVPLLLEELRDRPAHWFTALRATANVDPAPPESNPAAAREAWLEWGKSHGLID